MLHNTLDNLPYEVQLNQQILNLAEKPNKCQKDLFIYLFISSDKKTINTTRVFFIVFLPGLNKLLKKKKMLMFDILPY